MNKFERYIYDLVKYNPGLKRIIRNTLQNICDLFPSSPNYSINSILEKRGFFFGFHDICPFSFDGNYILSNKLNIPLRMPTEQDYLTVGYWNKDYSDFVPIANSHAWNYHKGCRLQWCGEKSHTLIFNDYIEGSLCSVMKDLDLENGNKAIIPYPIDTVSPDGKYATSFSYSRLNEFMPGYGYMYEDDSSLNDKMPDSTGLFIIDLDKSCRKLILSLKDLSEIQPQPLMACAYHYVTHTEFSPDGKQIAFLHRWTADKFSRRFSRLVICDINGKNITILNTTGMVSHFDWNLKNGIIAYCQVNGVDGHYLFNANKLQEYRRVCPALNSDGHQSFIPYSDCFITDTYPDKYRRVKLYIVNLLSNEKKLIADLKSPKKYQSPDLENHWACDLHPRVSPDGRFVCFDSVHNGIRSQCIMNLPNIKKDYLRNDKK